MTFENYAILEGCSVALGISLLGYFLSILLVWFLRAKLTPTNAVLPALIPMAVRFAVAVTGLIVVILIFGRTWAVPCAIAMIPLYLLETFIAVWEQVRSIKTTRK
ncbi:MAG: hypothetical protein ACRCUY_02370 [Thermoguttaceae bacterium]